MKQITVITLSSIADDDSKAGVLAAKKMDKGLLKSVPSHRHVEKRREPKNSQQQSTSGIVSVKRGHFKRKGTKLCTMDVSLWGKMKDNVGSGGTMEW